MFKCALSAFGLLLTGVSFGLTARAVAVLDAPTTLQPTPSPTLHTDTNTHTHTHRAQQYQNDLTTETHYKDDRDFASFQSEMSFGWLSFVASPLVVYQAQWWTLGFYCWLFSWRFVRPLACLSLKRGCLEFAWLCIARKYVIGIVKPLN